MDVEIRTSRIPYAGRGLFAKRDFRLNEIVLQLERPFVAELETARMHDTCAWCFQRGPGTEEESAKKAEFNTTSRVDVGIKACTGCRRVRYCSKACQSRAWKREHKYECKAIGVEGRPDLPHGVRAVIKLLGKLKNDSKGKNEQLLDILHFLPAGGGGKNAGKQLEEMKSLRLKKFEDFDVLAFAAWKYSGEPELGGMDSLAIAKGLFYNVMSNTIVLDAPTDSTTLGVGFDPILCSANHNCDPNTVSMFNEPGQLLRAIKPIKSGDEIFLQYCDVTMPFSIRQSELRQEHAFRCRCPKCIKGAVFSEDGFLKSPEQLNPDIAKIADNLVKRHEKDLAMFYVPANDENAQRRVAALQAEAFSVLGITQDSSKRNASTSEEEVLDALRLCLNSGLWSYSRQPVPRLIGELINIYLTEGRAYQHWRLSVLRAILIDPVLFAEPFHPDRVRNCWAAAMMTNSLCVPQVPACREIFDQCMQEGLDLRVVCFGFLLNTRDNIDKSYGQNSPFGRVVESFYHQKIENADISLDEIRHRIKQIWPKLEIVARSIDVLRL